MPKSVTFSLLCARTPVQIIVTLITHLAQEEIVEQERGFPAASILSILVLAAVVLALSLSGADPRFVSRLLSAAASVAALSAALVSASVLVRRGFMLDPFAGLALLYAVPGFLLASAAWALEAAAIGIVLGPLSLSKWLWYSSWLLIMLTLWELGVAARKLSGLKLSEVTLALALPLAYAALLSLIVTGFGASTQSVVETFASSIFLVLSLLALLPIRRKRYSWGLTLMTAGSAAFMTAVPLVTMLSSTAYAPLSIALHTLSFIFAASGIYVYGGESVLLR